MITMLEDLWDLDWWFAPTESEEMKAKREKLREAQREYSDAKQRAREEERKRESEEIAPLSPSFSLFAIPSEERFRVALEKYAKEHPDEDIRGYAIDHPNMFYRAFSIKRGSK